MSFRLLTHADCTLHDTGEHPECIARYACTLQALEALPLLRVEPLPISQEHLEWVHPKAHGERIKDFCAQGGGRIDEDTVACPASYEVALLAAGGALEGVDAVMKGESAFVLCRPPGHHALEDSTMGFCFFNNAALAVRYAQRQYGLSRVAVIDWDVHHGNGTEAIFYNDPSVLFVSTHQEPNWPGTGKVEDLGAGAGLGKNINVPLPIGTGDKGYLRAFQEIIGPIVAGFKPQLIVLSAGYDAHWRDPLGAMGLSVSGFARLTHEVKQWAEQHCEGRLLPILEGGYDLEALAQSVVATIQVLRNEPVTDSLGVGPQEECLAEIEAALERSRQALKPHWPGLFEDRPL
jgi:acetoin utilization deacetylase AcuC-like enzyme